jgi:hypothetical protein
MTLRSKAVKIIVKGLTVVLFFLTTIMGVTFINRTTLPYNSQGRSFDPKTETVKHQQSAEVYGVIAVVLLLSTIISGYVAFRKPGR